MHCISAESEEEWRKVEKRQAAQSIHQRMPKKHCVAEWADEELARKLQDDLLDAESSDKSNSEGKMEVMKHYQTAPALLEIRLEDAMDWESVSLSTEQRRLFGEYDI